MTTHLAILTDPAGVSAFLCYAAPGLTQDRSAATAFASEHVARRAANAAIYGEPDAFWPSERASAARTRRERKGWTATTEAKETGQ
tara:strand:+ start:164 stop:421 length:258 start_codon:yes stop_codon:yes gene_type:complete